MKGEVGQVFLNNRKRFNYIFCKKKLLTYDVVCMEIK